MTIETHMQQINLLKDQIDELKYGLYVDSYPMSLLELVNLYLEGDINLKAEYQRIFKWTNDQKTKFIESLFLGLPIPPIFLYQDENAMWEVVDGIQRLSTVFEFFGKLKNEDGEFFSPLILTKAPKLTQLEDLEFNIFPDELKREFRKLKLDLIIISKKSGQEVKLEIFRRLNGFGTILNPQELRNALILLASSDFFKFVDRLSNYTPFLNCFGFNENQMSDKKHYEYVIRYLILRDKNFLLDFPTSNNTKIDDLFDYCIINIIENNAINIYEEENVFKSIFNFLSENLGTNSFKKYYHEEENYQRQVRESIFDVIIPGLSNNLNYYEQNINIFIEKVKCLYLADSDFERALAPNPKAIDRMKKLVPLSEEYFRTDE